MREVQGRCVRVSAGGTAIGRSLPHQRNSVSPNEMAGLHRCADLHDDHLLAESIRARLSRTCESSWRSPPRLVRNRYVPQMIAPALTDVRIFMTCLLVRRNPLGSPDDRAGFHDVRIFMCTSFGDRSQNGSVAPDDGAGFHSCANLHGLTSFPLTTRFLPGICRPGHDPCEPRDARLTRRIMVATPCKEPYCQYRRSSASIG